MGPSQAQGRRRLPDEESFRVHREETAGWCGGICRVRRRLWLPPRVTSRVDAAHQWRNGWISANVFVTWRAGDCDEVRLGFQTLRRSPGPPCGGASSGWAP